MNPPFRGPLCLVAFTLRGASWWFIPVVACVRTSFLFKAEYNSGVWTDRILLIQSSVDGYMGYFYFFFNPHLNTREVGPNQLLAQHLPGTQ